MRKVDQIAVGNVQRALGVVPILSDLIQANIGRGEAYEHGSEF